MNSSNLLWNDFDVYQRRYKKSANALVAMRSVLRDRNPVGSEGDEFLAMFDRVTAFDANLFTRVWSDPTAYFWTRLGYEFLGNCLAPGSLSALAEANAKERGLDGDPHSALKAHLSDFNRFVLGLAILSGQDVKFRTPLEVRLPFAIPGTELVVEGRELVSLTGFLDDCIQFERDARSGSLSLTRGTGDALSCYESPVATIADYRLALKPEMFNLPGLAVGGPLLEVSRTFERQQVGLTEQALNTIDRYAPASFQHLRTLMRAIALKPPGVGSYTNISHSDLPGSFVCTVIRNEYWMADAFIHEFYHNRLFFIEELGAFFDRADDNQANAGEFYSPWRNDLRPLHGLLHGLYVYIPLWRFWFSVASDGDVHGDLLLAARDQVLRGALQLAVAVAQLRRNARFSEFGAEIFNAMAAEVESIFATTRALRFPRDLPAMTCDDDGVLSRQIGLTDGRQLSVTEAILRHADRFDHARQCEDLDSIVTRCCAS